MTSAWAASACSAQTLEDEDARGVRLGTSSGTSGAHRPPGRTQVATTSEWQREFLQRQVPANAKLGVLGFIAPRADFPALQALALGVAVALSHHFEVMLFSDRFGEP